jgi:cytochrome P450
MSTTAPVRIRWSRLLRDPLAFFLSCASEYGDVVPVSVLGLSGLVLSHPAHIKEVLVDRADHFALPRLWRRSENLIGDSLLRQEGPAWREQRRLVQAVLAQTDGYLANVAGAAEARLATWRPGVAVDIPQEMWLIAVEVVWQSLFGAGVPLPAEAGAALARAIEQHMGHFRDPGSLVPVLSVLRRRRFRRARDLLDARIHAAITERRRLGSGGDLVGRLLAAGSVGGRTMDDRQLRDEVLALLLAGADTTTIALTWTWFVVGREAGLQARARADAEYAEAVVREVLRLYPPAWLLARTSVRECEIGGRTVQTGTVVGMSQWAVHRDPRFYAKPEAFCPERWLDAAWRRALPPCAYFPFGAGPRACVGMSVALRELTAILTMVLERFDLEPAGGGQLRPVPSVSLRPAGDLRLVPVPR